MNAGEFCLDVELVEGPADGLKFEWPQGRDVILVRWQNEVFAYKWQARTSKEGRWLYRALPLKVGVVGSLVVGFLGVLGQPRKEGGAA